MDQSKRFHELDALRGIAALAVVLFHYTGYVIKNHFGDFPFYFTLGERGVQLFFLVSGFVIYFTLERSKSLKDFAFSRFTRLYPTYWAAIAVWAIFTLVVLRHRPWITGLAANATMLQKFIGVEDLDVVFWTLAIELVFYAWMATIFSIGWLQHFTAIALVWLSASLLWAIARKFYDVPETIDTYFILQHIPYFIAGIMFRRIQTQGWSRPSVALLAFAILDNYLIKGLPELFASVAFFSVFALAVGGYLKPIAHPIFLWLGAISYPLYVLHRSMGYELLQMLHDHGVASTVSIPLMVLAALAFASLITYLYEKPVIKMLSNWYRSKSVIQRSATAPSHRLLPKELLRSLPQRLIETYRNGNAHLTRARITSKDHGKTTR